MKNKSTRKARLLSFIEPLMIDHALAVAERLESGAVSINQPTMPAPSIPFGGIKESGFGRELGADGIREFMNHKYVNGVSLR